MFEGSLASNVSRIFRNSETDLNTHHRFRPANCTERTQLRKALTVGRKRPWRVHWATPALTTLNTGGFSDFESLKQMLHLRQSLLILGRKHAPQKLLRNAQAH